MHAVSQPPPQGQASHLHNQAPDVELPPDVDPAEPAPSSMRGDGTRFESFAE